MKIKKELQVSDGTKVEIEMWQLQRQERVLFRRGGAKFMVLAPRPNEPEMANSNSWWAVNQNIVDAGLNGGHLIDAIADLFQDEILDWMDAHGKVARVHLELLPWKPSSYFLQTCE